MDVLVSLVFLIVYAGMFLGGLPGLALDRTGIALLGAIALVAAGKTSVAHAWAAIDVSTIALLLGLMVVSAQFRLAGFYTAVTRRLGARDLTPARGDPGALVDTRRQPADRRQHREHHRDRSSGTTRCRH